MKNFLKTKKNKGFTLLIAIITTSMLLIVSFVVVNIALKQLVLANAASESQYAFYNADSGTECAVYWDLKDPASSPFNLPFGNFSCDYDNITPTLVSNTGGNLISTITINLTKGCAIVRITKSSTLTTIDSRGYNTCVAGASRRFERGVTLTY